MARNIKPKLLRLIFQARYKPELSYFALATSAAARFEKEYPAWQRTVEVDVRLINYQSHCALDITNRFFAYSQDSGDVESASARIQRALAELPDALHIPRYTRLGLRHLVVVPVNMNFDSLATVMGAKLFTRPAPLKEVMPAEWDDLLYRIDGSEGEYKFHVTVAPVKRAEISAKIINLQSASTIDPEKLPDAAKAIEEAYPDVAVFCDVDMYWEAETIECAKAYDFVRVAEQRIGHMVGGLSDYLLQTTVQQP